MQEIRVTPDKKLVNEKGQVLSGAVITQFLYDYDNVGARLSQARSALKTVAGLGVNAVIYVTNSSFFDNERYLSNLRDIVVETNRLGLPVLLSLHSHGSTRTPGQSYTTPHQLLTIDSTLGDKWLKLLRNRKYGRDLLTLTGAYILLQEAGPVYDSQNR